MIRALAAPLRPLTLRVLLYFTCSGVTVKMRRKDSGILCQIESTFLIGTVSPGNHKREQRPWSCCGRCIDYQLRVSLREVPYVPDCTLYSGDYGCKLLQDIV